MIWGLVVATVLSMFAMDPFTAKAEEVVIKVGYDANSNFIKKDNGEYYGYGVEYLDKIAEYTDWKYEYINDTSWQESLEKLRNGEIDLICTAHYTEERAEEFLYSDIPLGYETTLLYTRADSEIFYQDYDAMDGSRVGLLKESYSASEFEEYAKEHGIECETTYYKRENDMLAALENGEIDMLAIGSRYATIDLKLLDRLGANAFYCITNKENEALINEIEDVLQQIMFDDPKFEGELNAEYFGHESISHTPLYTKEELEFIQNAGVIKLKIMMNQRPSCYEENGEVKGIWVEYLKLLSEKSGIQFDIEIGQLTDISEEQYNELLQQDYLLFRTYRAREYNNRLEENISTVPLASTTLSYIQRKDEFVQERNEKFTIALTKDLSYTEQLLLEENPAYTFKYYTDGEACMEALLEKEVDMVIQSTYFASYLMQKPEYADKLAEVPGTDYTNKIVLVAGEDQQVLIDILNKAINHITVEEKDAIVTRELLLNPYPIGLEDIFYQHWEWIISLAGALVIVLVIYTIMTHRMAKLQVQKKEYELLQKKVQLDELTGLYNRTYFYEIAKQMIENAEEEMCILTMDISNFKVVNELYGMSTGDRLLKDIADQILALDQSKKFIPARFMADHFYMCMPRAEFEKIHFPKSFETFLEDMDIKVVYGVFFVEDQKDLPINLMCDRAELAAHEKNYKYVEYIHFYNDAIRQEKLIEQEIENEMEKALAEKQFYIVVQPKYNVNTQEIIGGEVLVRWKHPKKGIVSPGLFIKVFEKNGFITQLDYFVWEETYRLQAKLKAEGIKTVPLSINVSRAHFYGTELKNKLVDLLYKYNIEPEDIELEITESICGEEPDLIYDKIRELQSLGFKIAMDDFGSGYSSLNMLKEMPLDIIKMDLKFLDGGENELKSHYILKSLIDLARAMDLRVIVEGVETKEQVEFLKQFYDCYAQGYFFSRPIECDIFKDKLMN